MPEGNRALGMLRLKWKDNIKLCLKVKGHEGMEWIELAQDKVQWRALVNKVMTFGFIKGGGFLDQVIEHELEMIHAPRSESAMLLSHFVLCEVQR
jgi:hypothetical protein